MLSVVTKSYKLITNKLAIEWGKSLFKDIFDLNVSTELKPFKVISSSRKTFCHIDLIHEEYNDTIWEQDCWLPFIRITNSYNKTYPLVYRLGFVRKLCSNGMIFDAKMIKIKQSHTSINLSKDFVFQDLIKNYSEELKKIRLLKNDFVSTMDGLYKLHIPTTAMPQLVTGVIKPQFRLNHPNLKIRDAEQRMQTAYNEIVNSLTEAYKKELGENAYCVLNVMTDLVSHGDEYNCLPSFLKGTNQYHHSITTWAQSFPKQFAERSFKWDNYLKQLTKSE